MSECTSRGGRVHQKTGAPGEHTTQHGPWELRTTDRVAVVTFRRPPRNFARFADVEKLLELLRTIAEDDGVDVAVLTSDVPGYFMAHADLDDVIALGTGGRVSGDPHAWYHALRLIEAMPQPVVAAVNGQAWGGGCELCLACTVRIAAESAHFGQPEVKLGLVPGAGGTQRLAGVIGIGRAAELVLSGRTVGSAEALAIGLVSDVLSDEGFAEAAVTWVRTRFAAQPRAALAAAKRALIEGRRLAFEDGLRLEGQLFASLASDPATLALERAALSRYQRAAKDERVEL